jgi:pilus assembly protein Flp/PilA
VPACCSSRPSSLSSYDLGRLPLAAHSVAGIECNLTVPIYRTFKRAAYFSGMTKQLQAFLKDESGATAIEYGLIASGIAIAIITVLKGTGTNLKTTFGSVSTAVK